MIKIGNRGSSKQVNKEEEEKIFKLSDKISFDIMLNTSREIFDRSEDYIVERGEYETNITVGNYGIKFKGKEYVGSNLALNQLCRIYDVPKKFVNSLLEKSVGFAKKNNDLYYPMIDLVNDLFNKQLIAEKELKSDRKLMFRTMKETKDKPAYVRAIVSDRYCPMDNYQLLESCKNVISQYYVVNSAFIDDEDMIGRFYFKEGFIVNNRRFVVGVEIRNSEVGNYSLQVKVIVSCSEFGSFVLTSTPIIRLKHSGTRAGMLDIAIELEELATTMKKSIEEKVRILFLDDNLNTKSLDAFMASIKEFVSKDEYNQISKLSVVNGKIHFLNGMYSIIHDCDYSKLDKVENEVTRQIFGQLIL